MKRSTLSAALGLSILLLSGCYTVMYGPRTAAELGRQEQERELAALQNRSHHEPPTVGRFDRFGDDFYNYPGVPSRYGGGYGYGGYPMYGFGIDSRYGYYDYGLSPHYYGYSPYSYGYDPYYRDRAGYHIPVGYELVSQRELDELLASRRALAELERIPLDSVAERQRRLEEQRKQEETWSRRTQSSTTVRTAPPVTPPQQQAPAQTYSPPPPKPAASGSGSSSSSSSSSQSSSESSSEQQSGRPPERTRTRR